MSLGARLGPILIWTAPVALSLAVFYPGLQCWFRMDDFAWLGLKLEVYSWHDFWRVLFEPRAQGTIRTLSERLFFLAFFTWFELDALPYRAFVFATHIANLMLVGLLARRLTGSVWVAFWSMSFWGVNAALSTPLSWTSVYNQVLCATFLLGALLLFIRFCDTGRTRFYMAAMAVFAIGFGALEMNVVFPALATAFALLWAKRRLPWTLPFFALSAAYTLLHNRLAPKHASGTYGMYWDSSMLDTLRQYALQAFGSRQLRDVSTLHWAGRLGDAASWILIGGLAGFTVWRLARRDWSVLFPVVWFFALIGPVLPLKNHVSLYYLTMPGIGLSLLAAYAATTLWGQGRLGKTISACSASLYLLTTIPVSYWAVKLARDRSLEVRHMVFGVEQISKMHPGKAILLTNVTSDMFWWGLNDRPFRLIGIHRVFLAPGAEEQIATHLGYGDPVEHLLAPGQTLAALDRGEAVVYSLAPHRLTNVTRGFHAVARTRWKPGLASRIDVGQALYSNQLGDGWNQIESGFRWMRKRAVVWLASPASGVAKLYLSGYCAAAVVEKGPVHLSAVVDGKPRGTVEVAKPDTLFEYEIPLKEVPAGAAKVEVVLEVDRVLEVPGEEGGLGLVFRTVALQ
jgi:hypothetical protein